MFSVYGIRLTWDRPLRTPLPPVGVLGADRSGRPPPDRPDLEVVSSPRPPAEVEAALCSSSPGSGSPDSSSPDSSGEPPGRVLWQSPERDADDRPATVLRRIGPWDVLRFPGIADFHLRDRRIVVVPAADASPALVELRLLGPVLAYWLEHRRVLTLHASGVVLEGRAVGFLAGNHAGKTSLALEMMEQGGALLTDDLLAVEAGPEAAPPVFLGRPGYPQVRLWVPDAERLLPGRARDLPTVHPAYDKRRVPVGEGGVGRFHGEAAPLAAVFLPEHRPDVDRVRVEPLPPPEAVIALLAGSYLPRLAPAAGLQEGRLDLLARLVEAVPVRRLVYPRGIEHLPGVARSVRASLRDPG